MSPVPACCTGAEGRGPSRSPRAELPPAAEPIPAIAWWLWSKSSRAARREGRSGEKSSPHFHRCFRLTDRMVLLSAFGLHDASKPLCCCAVAPAERSCPDRMWQCWRSLLLLKLCIGEERSQKSGIASGEWFLQGLKASRLASCARWRCVPRALRRTRSRPWHSGLRLFP